MVVTEGLNVFATVISVHVANLMMGLLWLVIVRRLVVVGEGFWFVK